MSICRGLIASVGALALLVVGAAADIPPPSDNPPKEEAPAAPASPNAKDAQSPAVPAPGASPDETAPADGAPPAEGAAPADAAAPVDAREAIANALTQRDGAIDLPGGQTRVTVAEGFAFIDAADTKRLLVEVWGNPPAAVGDVLGAIIPRDVHVMAEGSWAAILTYENDGHVSDEDANSIDYDELLKEMQEGTAASNEERAKAGYETITLVGWAQKPSYDQKEHKLHWAKHLKFGADSHTLNYAIRALGRTGVLQVNVVGDMKQLADINAKVPQLLSMVSFNEGHRYADFKEGVDPVAVGGIAALIAGGAAVKAGLFKGLIALLAASWKFVAIGVVALGGLLWRLFSRRSKLPSTDA